MNLTLKPYKNYQAIVNYSEEDKVYFGKIARVTDLISFEAETLEELQTEFEYAVDDYIETCKSLNK